MTRSEDDELVQPSRRASKAHWVAYRVAQGRDAEVVERWSKAELIAGRPDAPEDEEPAAEPEPERAPAETSTLGMLDAHLERHGHTRHPLAGSARRLAMDIDDTDKPNQRATAARELRMTLGALSKMDSEFGNADEDKPATDGAAPTALDKVRARRAARTKKAAGADA